MFCAIFIFQTRSSTPPRTIDNPEKNPFGVNATPMKMYTPDTPQNRISKSMFNTFRVFSGISGISLFSTAAPLVVINLWRKNHRLACGSSQDDCIYHP